MSNQTTTTTKLFFLIFLLTTSTASFLAEHQPSTRQLTLYEGGGVNLGAAAQFVLLAQGSIGAQGTSSIIGNVASTLEAADSVGLTAAEVIGTIYTSVYNAIFGWLVPSVSATAVADAEAAYSTAVSFSNAAYANLNGGVFYSATLSPGLYNFGGDVTFQAGNVTLQGSASDHWIFQVAGNLNVAGEVNFLLAEGVQAANIVWAVAGNVEAGANSAVKGAFLAQGQVNLGAGASLQGSSYSAGNTNTNGNSCMN